MTTADCVAVFDWDEVIDLPAWLDFALENFDKARMKPDVALCGSEANRSKNLAINELRSAVRKNKRGCHAIQLFATRPGYKQLAFGWRMCAILNVAKEKTAILSCETESLNNLEVAKGMAAIFGPVYGIGFQRPFLRGPDLYAYGLAAGLGYSGADRIEMNRIGAWMRERMGQKRHKNGMIRDIYPLNLLTELHVQQQIEHRSLQEWIRQDEQRGSLAEVGNRQWVWQLPAASLDNVRISLRSAGLIIAE